MLPAEILIHFPKLAIDRHDVSSQPSPQYNCIAWAAEDDTMNWWPGNVRGYFWPEGVPRDNSLAAFVWAFGTLGYELCTDGEFEAGYQKIVLYGHNVREVTHAARQLPNELWTSKLGPQHDIWHEHPDSVICSTYGAVLAFMRRSIQDSNAPVCRRRIQSVVGRLFGGLRRLLTGQQRSH